MKRREPAGRVPGFEHRHLDLDAGPPRDLGRLAADADVDTLAPTLIGAAHLLFADQTGAPPEASAVAAMVTAVLAGASQEPRSPASPRTYRADRD